MCYSNSSTSTNVELSKRYKKSVPPSVETKAIFYASGFSFPDWRIITNNEYIEIMRWGLIPSWFNGQDSKEIASLTLNAKIETIKDKPSFKQLVDRQHCIVPSNGFFEWKTIGKDKIPYFIYPKNTNIFSMAGLYDRWMNSKTGEFIASFTILTCPANQLMEEIHNLKKRMPCLLLKEQEQDWLNGKLSTEYL